MTWTEVFYVPFGSLAVGASSLTHSDDSPSATPLDLFAPQVNTIDAARGGGSGGDDSMGGVARRSTVTDNGAFGNELKSLALASGRG